MSGVGDWRHLKKTECPHISELDEKVTSQKDACEARLPDGQACGYDQDLRICLTCGGVFCCESHNSHNKKHFQKTGHPFIKPQKSDYNWLWCYKCNGFLE